MYTLLIPKEKMNNSLLFEYIDANNKASEVKSKKGCALEIKELLLLTAVLNNKNEDVSKKYSKYVYDISLYHCYQNLLKDLVGFMKKSKNISMSGVSLKKYLQERQKSRFAEPDNFNARQNDDTIKNESLCQAVLFNTILYFQTHRHSVFIRHGNEIFSAKQYASVDTVFPLQSASCWKDGVLYVNTKNKNKSEWSKEKRDLKKNKIAFPIEVDMLPFCHNLSSYQNRKWPKDEQYGYCSNHDALFSWNKLKGYIPYQRFKELNGSVINSKRRDHLYATSDIDLKEWAFVFQNIEEDSEKSKHWGWTQNDFTPAQFKHSIHLLIKNGVKVLSKELIVELSKFRYEYN